MNGEPYIRKKGKKFVIEYKDKNNKTHYIKTLPPAKELINLLCQDAKPQIASQNKVIKKEKGIEKVAQFLLDEPTKGEISETLKEITR